VTAEQVQNHLRNGGQILKTRDDQFPVLLERADSDKETGKPFRVAGDRPSSWAKADESFGPEKLRPRIEPWLTALAQSEHLSLLLGSGLTHAVHGIATTASLPGMSSITFDVMNDEIAAEAERSAKVAGRAAGNFEDQLRAANDLLRGLKIVASTKAEDALEHEDIEGLQNDLRGALGSFARSILEGERQLVSAPPENREQSFTYLVSFLMSFASRSGTRDRLHLFTTNYDRYLEAAADVAGLRLIDRFVGTLAPVFRASRLDVDLHYPF
jgi:hypothetical protein